MGNATILAEVEAVDDTMKCPKCNKARNNMNAKMHIERYQMCYSCYYNVDVINKRGRLT